MRNHYSMGEINHSNTVEPKLADDCLEIHDFILPQVAEIFRDFVTIVLPNLV